MPDPESPIVAFLTARWSEEQALAEAAQREAASPWIEQRGPGR